MLAALSAEGPSWARLDKNRVVFGPRSWEVEADSSVALSQDGDWVATASRTGQVKLWFRGRPAGELNRSSPVVEIAFSQDGSWFALATGDRMSLYKSSSLRLFRSWDLPSSPRCLAVKEASAAAGLSSGELLVGTEAGSQTIKRSERPLSSVAWLGEELVCAGLDGSLWFGDSCLQEAGSDRITALAAYQAGKLIAIASRDIRLLKASDGGTLSEWPFGAEALDFAGDGTLVALLPKSSQPVRLRLSSGPKHSIGITLADGPGVMEFSTDSAWFAVSCFRRLELWQTEPVERIAHCEVPGGVAALAFEEEHILALVDNCEQILTLSRPDLKSLSAESVVPPQRMMILPQKLALGRGADGGGRCLWDYGNTPPQRLSSFNETLGPFSVIELSPEGRYLVATTRTGDVEFPHDLFVWDLQNSQEPRRLGQFKSFCGPAFSERGLEIVADGRLWTWSLDDWSVAKGMSVSHQADLIALPDGRLMAGDTLLDPSSGSSDMVLDLGDRVTELAISPDGKWIAANLSQLGVHLMRPPSLLPWIRA